MTILEETMQQMPNSFTSNEFNKFAVKNGYPKERLKKKRLSVFIRKYADNCYEGSKTWIKKGSSPNSMTDEEMIISLKSKGYRILKSKENWIANKS